jgi:hypothetical protein
MEQYTHILDKKKFDTREKRSVILDNRKRRVLIHHNCGGSSTGRPLSEVC